MRKKIKDTDYLAISARIKAMENGLLTRERMEQVLEARTDEEALKLLQESGYPELHATDPESLDAALSASREETLADLADSVPDPRYIDIFKLKYDYHNVKAILKAGAMGVSSDHMLMDMGRVSTAELKKALQSGELENLPPMVASAAAEAREVLETTRDPQLSDIVLDRWCYKDMDAVAETTGSAFLHGYVKAQIDAANLRSLVRTIRMGKNETFLAGILFAGGDVAEQGQRRDPARKARQREQHAQPQDGRLMRHGEHGARHERRAHDAHPDGKRRRGGGDGALQHLDLVGAGLKMALQARQLHAVEYLAVAL